MKKFLYTLLILIILVGVAGYFLFQKAITPENLPQQVINAEEAIADSGTIAIASIDMSFIRRIDKMFSQVKDPSPLPASHQSDEDEEEPSLFEKLEKQGIDLIASTDQALASISIKSGKPAYSFVLFGRYSQAKLKQALAKHYLVENSSDNYLLLEKLPDDINKDDPCAKPVKNSTVIKHALEVKSNRIVLTQQDAMPALLKRLAGNARAGISLDKWRQFRQGKAVAAALMTPGQAKKGAVDLPSALILGALSEQPLQDIYAGAVVSVIPSPGFAFTIDAHSKEATWPLEFKNSYDKWANDAINELQDMPTLAGLIKQLSVKAEGTMLRIKTIATQQTLDNLEKIPGEFMQMAFSGVFDRGDTKAATAEKILKDSEVEKYIPQFDLASVKTFDATNEFYQPDYIAGPFAVRLKKIGLLDTDQSVIELSVGVDGKGFENLSGELMHKSDHSPVTSLSISSVEDATGNNLLREELCGKRRNSVAESLSSTRDKLFENNEWIAKSIKVAGNKSVRLKPNVFLSQVAKIKGEIEVRAATRTRTQTLKPPFKGKTVENKKVRMYLRKGSPGAVKYTLSGDIGRILAVRAKNDKGQYLSSAGSSSSGKKTKRISKRFSGKVASIEVVIAEEMKSQKYPFEISQVIPKYGKKGNGKKVEMKVTSKSRFQREYKKVVYENECKDKQTKKVGAFMVCLNKFGDRWGRETGGEFDVIAPYEEALQNDMSAVVLSIDSVTTDTGEQIKFTKSDNVKFEYKFDASYNDKKKDWEIRNRRLRGAYVKVFSDDEKLKNKKIASIKGSLTVRLAKSPKFIDLDADGLGIVQTRDGLTANISAFEDWNTYIDIRGKADKVMRFMPLAKDGTVLSTGNDRINIKQYQTFGLSKEDKEKIEALPKKWQGMVTIYDKPETVRLVYANQFETMKHKFEFALEQSQ